MKRLLCISLLFLASPFVGGSYLNDTDSDLYEHHFNPDSDVSAGFSGRLYTN